MYKLGHHATRMILRILGRKPRFENKEKIPNGPYVVVCTHNTFLDILYLAFSVYPTPVHFMAKQELFKNKLFGKILTSVKAFPVNRENPGPSAIKTPIKLLRKGNVVGIFPSGTRNSEQTALKRGAVTIALKAGVPLLPAVYMGPKSIKEVIQRKPITVRFGDPILLTKEDAANKDIFDQVSDQLQQVFHDLEHKKH